MNSEYLKDEMYGTWVTPKSKKTSQLEPILIIFSVEQVREAKLLGLHLNKKVSWSRNIDLR